MFKKNSYLNTIKIPTQNILLEKPVLLTKGSVRFIFSESLFSGLVKKLI